MNVYIVCMHCIESMFPTPFSFFLCNVFVSIDDKPNKKYYDVSTLIEDLLHSHIIQLNIYYVI